MRKVDWIVDEVRMESVGEGIARIICSVHAWSFLSSGFMTGQGSFVVAFNQSSLSF